MSTLVENVAKVTAAHAALKTAIAAKGVTVPEGTKLTGMPALVEQISTEPVPTNPRAVFAYDTATSIVVPKVVVVDISMSPYLSYCFNNCRSLTSLTLQAGFGQNATNISYCFNNCRSLTPLTLPAGFGQNATTLENCFSVCSSLTSLTLPDGFGQNATNISYCFYGCTSLTSLTLPDGFGQNATRLINCFNVCSSLTNIAGNPNFKVSLDLSDCTQLTHDSLMVVINGLQTVTTSQVLTLGATNLAKLTDEEKKVATDKGWTVA